MTGLPIGATDLRAEVRAGLSGAMPELTSDQVDRLAEAVSHTPKEAARTRIPEILEAARDEGGSSGAVDLFAASIADELGISRSDVHLKALALVKLAAEAERRGRKLVVIDAEDRVISEIAAVSSPLMSRAGMR